MGIPGVNLVENLGIAGVIVAHQFAVLDTEAIAPEGKMTDRWVILCEWVKNLSIETIANRSQSYQ